MGLIATVRKLTSYDKRLIAWIGLAGVLNSWAVLAPLVNHYEPDFECDVSHVWRGQQDNYSSPYLNTTAQRVRDFQNFMIPVEENKKRSSCKRYNRTWDDFLLYETAGSNHTDFSRETVSCNRHKFNFVKGEYSASAQFEMVCEQSERKSMAVFAYMMGMGVGGIVSGYASDRLGRRPVFLFAQFSQFFGFSMNGFSSSYLMYISLTFFYGASGMVNFFTSLLLGAETTVRRNRNLVCLSMHFGYALGYVLFVPFAYLVRDWRWFCRIGGLFGLIYLPLIWIVDESPKWLMATGKKRRAEHVLMRIAKCNGTSLHETSELLLKSDEKDQPSSTFCQNFSMIFSQPFLLVRLLVMAMAWCMANVSYYGISLTTNALSGNRFLNCLYAGISEFVSYAFTFFFIEYHGRRSTYVFCMATAGVCIAASPWISIHYGNVNVAVTIFAKFLISNCFYVVYIMTSEIFPTAIRHTASSIDSGFSRVGGIITSFIIYGDKFVTAPLVGGFSILSACLFFLLPKTHNEPLPETIEEARRMKRGIPKLFLSCQGLSATSRRVIKTDLNEDKNENV